MNLTSSNPPSLMTTHLDPAASTYRLILDHVQDHEVQRADQVYLTQPLGQGQVRDYTWRETLVEARRMARHLQSQGFEPGARIGLITKNCAHFIMAELAIWLAGGTTVALFPTESTDNLRFVLEHSETRLLFVGKLDNWARQRTGVPEGLPCIALPLSDALAQQPNLPCWEDIVASTEALNGRITRDSQDLALLAYTSGSTGEPKGVMHSFGGISDASERTMVLINERTGHPSQHRVLSYLPLSHIFERSKIACWSLVAGNVQVFFSESLATFVDDLKRARPNSFISVPRLWLKFQHGVFAKIPAKKLDAALADPVKGQVVAKQVLASLGLDAVVSAGSGSAPISAELIAWYRKPIRKIAPDTEFDVRGLDALPRVDIAYCYAGADGAAIDAFVAAGAKGIVTAGFAPGYVTPAMVKAGEAAVAAGVKLVLSSRAGSGRTFRTQRGDKSGFISADNLTPQKARILLSLALTKGLDDDGIRRVFATY
jgi:long-subunit acyl-CoA synthetase (AMP-forming)